LVENPHIQGALLAKVRRTPSRSFVVEMASSMKLAAVAILSASASVEAFAPGVAGPQMRRRGGVARAGPLRNLRMQEQGSEKVAVLDKPAEPSGTPPLAKLNALEANRKQWGIGAEEEAAAPVTAAPAEEAAQAPPAAVEAAEPPPAPAPAQQKKAAAPTKSAEPNQFATMALKAGALKQSSPLIMSQMAGNKGFDPANFAKTPDLLLQYREAELKHARLAMLASVGWVFSELWHTPLADLLGKANLLQEDAGEYLAKAPSVLNGGLTSVPPFFWVVTLLFSGVVEATRMLSISGNAMDFEPGALGFDPLGFYAQESPKGKLELQTKEINNGRLAMLAIAFFAGAEYLGNTAIVDQTPGLFTEGPLSNAGNLGGLLEQYSGLLSCKSGLVYCSEGQVCVSLCAHTWSCIVMHRNGHECVCTRPNDRRVYALALGQEGVRIAVRV